MVQHLCFMSIGCTCTHLIYKLYSNKQYKHIVVTLLLGNQQSHEISFKENNLSRFRWRFWVLAINGAAQPGISYIYSLHTKLTRPRRQTPCVCVPSQTDVPTIRYTSISNVMVLKILFLNSRFGLQTSMTQLKYIIYLRL